MEALAWGEGRPFRAASGEKEIPTAVTGKGTKQKNKSKYLLNYLFGEGTHTHTHTHPHACAPTLTSTTTHSHVCTLEEDENSRVESVNLCWWLVMSRRAYCISHRVKEKEPVM